MSAVEQTKEPSMEEILASIRRIISEDDQTQQTQEAESEAAAPAAAEPATPEPAGDEEDQSSIDALFEDGDFGAAIDDDGFEGFDGFDGNLDALGEDDGEEGVLELSQSDIVGEPESVSDVPIVEPVTEDITFDDFDFGAPEPEPEAAPEPAPMEPEPPLSDLEGKPSFDEASLMESVEAQAETTLMSADTNAAVSAAFGGLANTILSNNARTLEDLVKEMLKPMLKAWMDDNLPNLVERLVREEIERVSRGGR